MFYDMLMGSCWVCGVMSVIDEVKYWFVELFVLVYLVDLMIFRVVDEIIE